MPDLCSICGKPLEEGEGPICKACQQQIQAEALGKKEEIARNAEKVLRGLGKRGQPRITKKGPAVPERREGEKGPRDFRSLAEYLEYLKGKGR